MSKTLTTGARRRDVWRFPGAVPTILGHPDLDKVVEGLFQLGARWALCPNFFGVVVAMKRSGGLEYKGMSDAPGFAVLEVMVKWARRDIQRGKARAFGTCLNISLGEEYQDDEIPVFNVRVEHADGQIAVVSRNYRIEPGGTLLMAERRVRFRETRPAH